MGDLVRVEDHEGGIRVFTVTRPEKLNALNAAVLDDLGRRRRGGGRRIPACAASS